MPQRGTHRKGLCGRKLMRLRERAMTHGIRMTGRLCPLLTYPLLIYTNLTYPIRTYPMLTFA